MKEIIVTDLTRFKNENIFCIAGIDIKTGKCIRPKPYLKRDKVEMLGIKPGTRLKGEFSCFDNIKIPHVEDYHYKTLEKTEDISGKDFYRILEKTSVTSIESGFKVDIIGKKILEGSEPEISIITLEATYENIEIFRDNYGKIRVDILDSSGKEFKSLAMTDHINYEKIKTYGSTEYINGEILASEKIYIRIGLSRLYQGAYWLQVNGIYCDINLL